MAAYTIEDVAKNAMIGELIHKMVSSVVKIVADTEFGCPKGVETLSAIERRIVVQQVEATRVDKLTAFTDSGCERRKEFVSRMKRVMKEKKEREENEQRRKRLYGT